MASQPSSFAYDFIDLGITKGMLLQNMGYAEENSADPHLITILNEVLEHGTAICNIRGGYILTKGIQVDRTNNKIYSHENYFDTGQVVTHQLRRSEQFAWFLCTAGEKISEYSRQLTEKGDLLHAYIVDVLANIVVEQAMDKIQHSMKEIMSDQGLKITNRYSPGYCDWDISEQIKLFGVFPGNYLDISLSESCLMKPLKSISGVIGIGKEVSYNEYTCNLCKDSNCMYRKIK